MTVWTASRSFSLGIYSLSVSSVFVPGWTLTPRRRTDRLQYRGLDSPHSDQITVFCSRRTFYMMSEVNIARKKEKCENCTKQCNKKQSDDALSSLQESGVANGEVSGHTPAQAVLLSACLSCDGCVSEEESQKISQQSLQEINRVLALNKKCDASKHKVLVVSVCPQSLPFFAVKFHLEIPEAAQKLCGFLKSVGESIYKLSKHVLSACLQMPVMSHMLVSLPRSLNLLALIYVCISGGAPVLFLAGNAEHESSVTPVCVECVISDRLSTLFSLPHKEGNPFGDVLSLFSGVKHVFDTTLAASFSILESQKEFVQRYRRRHHDTHAVPMFTSSCPGWIRYAEHVLGSLVTPHICTARSPQQVMGSLVKDYFARQQKLTPEQVYHVVVAPCFDKKLEAVREEFYNSMLESSDVDCVLTSVEILHMMEQSNVSMESIDPVPLDHVFGEISDPSLMRHDGRGSEGFLEHIFKHAAKELFGLEVEEIVYKTLRNRDFQEVVLERDGETLLQFAAVYGFRNIQTLVHRLRKGRVPYQLVEVLSCPGGCVSGRGQAEGEGGKLDRALIQQMEEAYSSLPVRLPEANPEVQRLYQDWLEGQDSPRANQILHTKYSKPTQPPAQTLIPDIQW